MISKPGAPLEPTRRFVKGGGTPGVGDALSASVKGEFLQVVQIAVIQQCYMHG